LSSAAAITVLADNIPGPGLQGEHGLSLWIETPEIRVLFDTGKGGALGPNAKDLGVDLSQADAIVLSHGHYDHTGGLPLALAAAPPARLLCHPGVTRERYSVREGEKKPVHMSEASRRALKSLSPQRRAWIEKTTKLTGNLSISGPVPRLSDSLGEGWPFHFDPDARFPDPIEDDMCLWLDTPDGLVVVFGCCHAGLADTLAHARREKPGRRIRCIIGGMHLMDSGDREIGEAIGVLGEHAPDMIVPLHCTGGRACTRCSARAASTSAIARCWRGGAGSSAAPPRWPSSRRGSTPRWRAAGRSGC